MNTNDLLVRERATPAANADERAIAELVQTWMRATKDGDVDKVLSLMADEVVFMVPGRAPFGKAAFATNARARKDVHIDGKAKIEEIVVAGDWAWCRTHLDVTIIPSDGQPKRRSGHTLSILRKKPNGQWVIARDANLLAPAHG